MSDFRRYVGRQVVLQLAEESLMGTLARDSREVLELEHAASLAPGREPKPIDGAVVVPKLHVEWMQVP